MPDSAKDLHLFVIGASAGGIAALERLVTALPPSFPGAAVIAQHLAPSPPSMLQPILARRTSLPVVSVHDRAQLTKGSIYVIPAGHHGEIDGSEVVITAPSSPERPRPSIDRLFKSAAVAFGDRVVAVVLSGMGADGADGATAVKDAGGMVIVQQSDTAAFPALPESIPPNLVDLVADIDGMGQLLSSLAVESTALEKIADPDVLKAFLTQLRGRSGIDFTKYKTPTITRRLSRLMAISRCSTLPEYLRYLNGHPDAYQRLVASFLINVTGFFRDPALYEYLEKDILPELVAEASANKLPLRFWSAGCSTGEEAYSLAIALAEILGSKLEKVSIRIFATDLDEEAIAFARRGIYPASALSGLPDGLRERYFVPIGKSYQVKKHIRNMTVFGEYDLGQRAPFPRIDLLLCRNVLIYFTKELQQRTLQLFTFSLRPGGFLVLGNSESTSPMSQYFSVVQSELKVFRRQHSLATVPSGTFSAKALASERPMLRRSALLSPARIAERPAPSSVADRLGQFLFDSPIGVVMVDRDYDILAINQAARTLLGIFSQGIGDDLIHLASEVPPGELKLVLDSAFRSEVAEPVKAIRVRDAATNRERVLQFACYPDRPAGQEGSTVAVVAIVFDITDATFHREQLDRQHAEFRAAVGELSKQNAELQSRQRSLVDANKELTISNDELRTTNEHLLVAAEEAEAAAEEVETLNEEMQATGEELETLNEELQATVEELNATNEELQARGFDLERQASHQEATLAEKQGLVDSVVQAFRHMPMAAALLDRNSVVLATTVRYDALAEQNNGLLRGTGERWAPRPERVSLLAGGRERQHAMEFVPSDNGGGLFLITSA